MTNKALQRLDEVERFYGATSTKADDWRRLRVFFTIFGGDPEKWIKFIEREGTAHEREFDLPLAKAIKHRFAKDPDAKARLQQVMREWGQAEEEASAHGMAVPATDKRSRSVGAWHNFEYIETIEDLSLGDRILLRMHLVEGLTIAEIAQRLEVSRRLAARAVERALEHATTSLARGSRTGRPVKLEVDLPEALNEALLDFVNAQTQLG